MNAGQIIVIALIIGGIILWNWVGKESKQDEAEKKARMEEYERKKREEEAKRTAERNERMKKYREEYNEYIRGTGNATNPAGLRPLSFDQWRKFHNKY